jgi:hypothetical protein
VLAAIEQRRTVRQAGHERAVAEHDLARVQPKAVAGDVARILRRVQALQRAPPQAAG